MHVKIAVSKIETFRGGSAFFGNYMIHLRESYTDNRIQLVE